MKRNMGTIDRALRILLAISVGVLYFTGTISGTVAIVLGILSIIFVITGTVGTCPIYSLVGLSTCKNS